MKLAKIKAQQRLKTGRRLIKYRNCNVFRKYGTTASLNGCHLKNPLNLAVVVGVCCSVHYWVVDKVCADKEHYGGQRAV